MNLWFIIPMFIVFQIFFCIASGGINIRSIYAIKISNSFFGFIKNYFWSYTLSSEQIQSQHQYIHQVNDKLEKLLTLALDGKTGCGYSKEQWSDNNKVSLRIQPNRLLDSNSDTIRFSMEDSKINGESFLLSPFVFYLANKVYKKLLDEEYQKKITNRRHII